MDRARKAVWQPAMPRPVQLVLALALMMCAAVGSASTVVPTVNDTPTPLLPSLSNDTSSGLVPAPLLSTNETLSADVRRHHRRHLQSCQDLTSYGGKAVCSTCCATWKNQGKCDGSGSTVLGGGNVKTVICPKTCGACATGPSPSASPNNGGGCPSGWSPAVGTLYDSWPKPNTRECKDYSGCQWAGRFNFGPSSEKPCKSPSMLLDGGNGDKTCRYPPDVVKGWNMAATYDLDSSPLYGKKLQVMVQTAPLRTVTVNVMDVCKDSDCKMCCRDNTGNKAWKLIDLEKGPASALLGFDTSSAKFDINDVNYPVHNGLRKGAASGAMALCYKIVGAADKFP
ncbi:hypothetical protein HXX76_010484 [Chlamydomonas incerta]|uniref:Uncharacterized protein n=1 Tax=Chlamydomonas incerta TaxID=51695 RepID=A0A835VWE1_CHLIN|nr:hypothetical protein HXX76_010484 [Chlamydomonas incerta]|eukprot:KAG2428338.1 hypothetical protein HXX76_010484 [Chlamydomonas incerta]